MQVPNSVCEPSFMVRLRHLPTLQKAQENVAPKPLAKKSTRGKLQGSDEGRLLSYGARRGPVQFPQRLSPHAGPMPALLCGFLVELQACSQS